MRVINVIEQSAGVINNVTSFAVWDEQLSGEVAKDADNFFKQQLLKNVNLDEDEEDDLEGIVDYGHYEEQDNNYYTIDIIWSEIE